MEVWKQIPEAPDYEASSLGRIRRATRSQCRKVGGNVLKPTILNGYERVQVFCNGRKKYRPVHRLVCGAFNGPQPTDKPHCAHRDGARQNNVPGNLYWATAKENADDRERHGTTVRGEKHWTQAKPDKVPRGGQHYRKRPGYSPPKGEGMAASKLTEADAIAIISAPPTLGSGKALSERYGVSMGLITAIRKGRAWAYLPR